MWFEKGRGLRTLATRQNKQTKANRKNQKETSLSPNMPEQPPQRNSGGEEKQTGVLGVNPVWVLHYPTVRGQWNRRKIIEEFVVLK